MGLYDIYSNAVNVFLYNSLNKLYPDSNMKFVTDKIALYGGNITVSIEDHHFSISVVITDSSNQRENIAMDLMDVVNSQKQMDIFVERAIKPVIDKKKTESVNKFDTLHENLSDSLIDSEIDHWKLERIDETYARFTFKDKDETLDYKFNYVNKPMDTIIENIVRRV